MQYMCAEINTDSFWRRCRFPVDRIQCTWRSFPV